MTQIDRRDPSGFDIAVIGGFIVLRSPTGEIVHFKSEEIAAIAERLMVCAASVRAAPQAPSGQ